MSTIPMAGPMIEFAGVTKRFGQVKALTDVSFSVTRGEVVGLLGPNGAGKTTLVRLVAMLIRPDAGSVRVEGRDVVSDAARVRRTIGMAGQLAAVDELLTGRENLRLIGRLYGLRTKEATARADDLLDRFGLVGAADRRVETYSGGMRRRLDLGVTLIGRPSVLLLDEPTAGLDPGSRAELWELVDEVAAAGTTVLLTSQYLEELDRLASRVVVLGSGRVLAEGSVEELKQTVGGHVVQVRLRTATDVRATEAILAGIGSGQVQRDAAQHVVTVAATDDTAGLATAVRELDAAGVVPVEIGLRLSSLNDVFFTLTGTTSGSARERGDTSTSEGEKETTPRRAGPIAPEPPHVTSPRRRAGALADVAALSGRYIRRMLRTPQLIFFATVQPVLFVLGLTAVFGGLVQRFAGGRYIQYLLPGVLVMNLTFAAGSTGIGLAEDMKAGIIDRFRSLPMARSAVLGGRTIADLVRNAVGLGAMALVGVGLGYRFRGPVGGAVAAFLLCLLFAYGLSMVFASIGLAVKDPQTAQFASFAPVLPLVFLSSAWLPIEAMTPVVRGFARHQPVNVTVDAVRSLLAGSVQWSVLSQSLAWSIGLGVIFAALATWQYQRATS